MSQSNDTPENMEEMTEADVENTEAQEETEGEVSIEEMHAQIEALQAKADKNWDTVLRMKADADNQRKRSDKQVEDAHKFAVKKFVEALLPVADSLEMGKVAEGDIEKIREGIDMTMTMFESTLTKFGVESVNPIGEKFNPELHQAIAMQPSEEYEEGCVSVVMQKGYTLNGRIVRPAMVMVVKN